VSTGRTERRAAAALPRRTRARRAGPGGSGRPGMSRPDPPRARSRTTTVT